MKKLTITTAILLIATVALGQGVAINEDGAAPHTSAMLEVTSTEKGVLIPRMTQAQREAISAPANGLLIFQTDEPSGFYFNAGTVGEADWQRLGKSAEISWAINGDDIYYQTGNVGIGTSTPQTKQHILGSGNPSTPLLTIENTQDNATALSLKTIYRTWNIGQNMEGLPLDGFYIYDQTVNEARMVISQSGNVGIGVEFPEAGLHTSGTVRFSGAGTPGTGKVLTSNANGNATWEDSYWIASGSNIHNSNSGNVGIGIINPEAKLNVDGHIRLSGTANFYDIYETNQTQSTGLRFYRQGFFAGAVFNRDNYINISKSNLLNGLVVNLNNNRVGIGTNDPSAQLHTTGSVRFSGAGATGEGKVLTSDANGTATWQPATATVGSALSCIDIDGNAYPTIVIGDQIWMAENLRVTKYRNGNSIPIVTDNAAWGALTSGAYCWYDNNQSANAKYGPLYNWYAVNDPRGLCPEGWRAPTDAEWTAFTTLLGGASVAGGKLKSVSALWSNPNIDATNSSGFSGLPAGYRYPNGNFSYLGSFGYWWTSTESSSTTAWSRRMASSLGGVGQSSSYDKTHGFSIRCLKD